LIPLRSLYITNVVLAALLACISYRTIDSYLLEEQSTKVETKKKKEAQAAPETQKITGTRYEIINEANIFRCRDIIPTPPPPPTPVPTPTPELPKLNLELKGTTIPIVGDMKAIIYNKKTRKTEYYGKGDVIPDCDDARIVEITRTSVAIDRRGQIDTLELYPDDKNPLKGGGPRK
jgi:type II secretory pathway component PulC